jgi:hypothetical protein
MQTRLDSVIPPLPNIMAMGWPRLTIVTLFIIMGFASLQGATGGPTVLLSSQAVTEEIHGVNELSLITSKGKAHPCTPKLGERIELLALDIDLWINELRKEGHIATQRDKDLAKAKADAKASAKGAEVEAAYAAKDHGRELIEEMLPRMVLILEGKAMTSLHAVAPCEDPGYFTVPGDATNANPPTGRWFSVQFQLNRDRDSEESKADWKEILNAKGVRVPMDVTLGIIGDDGKTIYGSPTYVTKGVDAPEQQFAFRRMPWDGWTATGTIVILGAFALFVYLAWGTSILRDPSQPIRPDGLAPVSLGRCQMAFWFFLVAGAFVFLWLITGRGDLDTISDSTLVLLGISAGTALGSAFVPAKDGGGAETSTVNYKADIGMAKNKLRTLDNDRVRLLSKAAASERTDTAAPPGPDIAALLAANTAETDTAMTALRKGREDMDAYRRAHPHQFLTDLLSEDGQTVTFHRFQIVVWTMVLGVVFVSEVLTRLAMPAFSSTLLLLMGISSGTYIGFKFTPNKPNPA